MPWGYESERSANIWKSCFEWRNLGRKLKFETRVFQASFPKRGSSQYFDPDWKRLKEKRQNIQNFWSQVITQRHANVKEITWRMTLFWVGGRRGRKIKRDKKNVTSTDRSRKASRGTRMSRGPAREKFSERNRSMGAVWLARMRFSFDGSFSSFDACADLLPLSLFANLKFDKKKKKNQRQQKTWEARPAPSAPPETNNFSFMVYHKFIHEVFFGGLRRKENVCLSWFLRANSRPRCLDLYTYPFFESSLHAFFAISEVSLPLSLSFSSSAHREILNISVFQS